MKKGEDKRVRVPKNAGNGRKKIMLTILALIVAGTAALAAYSLSIKNSVKEWDNKIYPGVTVQGVDLGGMTKEEAKNKLNETFKNAISEKKLSITIGDKQYELIYSDIIPNYDIDGTVDKAYNFGKDSVTLKKYIIIRGIDSKNQIPLGFSYDEEKLKAYEEKLQSDAAKSPQDATLSISGNNITINPEIEGRTIKLETLDEKLKENINGELNSADSITVDTEEVKPRVTKDDLSKIKGLMGTFSTSYATSAPGRCNNIEKATKAINGTVVMPGEVFSFNDTVGPRTVEKGYQEAGTYVGNKVEPGIGGGICQVSTTLYRSVMKANLRSVERTNHSMVVGYTQPGLDATVSYGYLDYKFKNTYDFPIYIQGISYGKALTYNIYGDPSALNGKTYDMRSEILDTIPPTTKIVPDDTLPEGQEVTDGAGMTGYRARAYQITYENGVEVNREVVSTDTYASVDAVVRQGTQPVESTATPVESTTTPEAQ